MSAAVAAAATAAAVSQRRSGTASRRSDTITDNPYGYDYSNRRMPQQRSNRYESQKREDWQSFLRYLRDQRRPMALSRLSEADIVQFLQYVDEEFGNTKVHEDTCSLFGKPSPPNSCPCPLRQAWGSLNALVCRLRAAFEENGGRPETNPFASSGVKLYLVEAREAQAKARGISFC